jgi:hypothetical protein
VCRKDVVVGVTVTGDVTVEPPATRSKRETTSGMVTASSSRKDRTHTQIPGWNVGCVERVYRMHSGERTRKNIIKQS